MIKQKKLGVVVTIPKSKTAKVCVLTRIQYPKYHKIYIKKKNFLIHDENHECKLGDFVIIEECSPISKLKSWKLNKILFTSKKIKS